MSEFEDVVVQLFLAGLYFGGVFVTVSVILPPESAFLYALVGLIVAMLGYLIIRALGYHKPGPILGIYISLGFAILTFGLIWWMLGLCWSLLVVGRLVAPQINDNRHN